MRSMIITIALLASVGCASVPEPAVVGEGDCRTGAVQEFVGQVATQDVGARMLAAAGARLLRWVAPGMAVTMDYRHDRLTVRIDSASRITAANCG